MTDYRQQAVKDVAEEVATPIETVKFILSEGFDEDCEEDLLLRYAVAQREARLRLEDALKGWQDHLAESLNCMDAKEQALFFAGRAALNAVKEG